MLKIHNLFLFKISSIGIYIYICRLSRGPTVPEKLLKIPLFGPSLIHQLWLLGSQQRAQSVVFLTSFSNWGIENSLAEMNIEIQGEIKYCLCLNVTNTCRFVGGRIIVQQEKISRAECSWMTPECA